MKLIRFSYHDKIKNWGFTDLKFDDINLFIGASGVGKSLILYSIDLLKNILLNDKSIKYTAGQEWDLDFEFGGNQYNWQARFSKSPNYLSDSNEKGNLRFDFEFESISKNNIELLSRIENEVTFSGKPFPSKLQANISLLELISEDEIIEISNEIKKITFGDFTLQSKSGEQFFYEESYQKNKEIIDGLNPEIITLEYIKSRDWHMLFKLYVVSLFYPELFEEINTIFSTIFPNVTEFEFLESGRFYKSQNGNSKELYVLYFLEEEANVYLTQGTLSSGMYRTLIHICELYLSPKGTVFLYDEFENSLGINCIDEITDLILNSENDYQFLLTSHHPYIINKIPAKNWKLVTRHGGKVKISNVYDEGIIDKNSKHEVFTQLIQSSSFKTGI